MGANAALWGTALETGLGFAGDRQNAQAASLRGRFQNDIAQRNAQISEMQSRDATNRGDVAANRALGETADTVSSSRAALAAQGVDISSGSAAGVVASENLIGNLDALQIKDNAAKEAWGFDVAAANQRMQGKLALLAGDNEAATDRVASISTLINGGVNAYKIYQLRGSRTIRPALPPGTRTDGNDLQYG